MAEFDEDGNSTLNRATSNARPRSKMAQTVRKARIREEEVREESLQRAGPRGPERLQRNKNRTKDRFYIDPALIPPGVSYEWKRDKCYGADDPFHMTGLMENHWKPVPADRHSNMVVEQSGMILMERPKYLTDEARAEDYTNAMGEVQAVSQGITETPANTFSRNHPSAQRVTGVRSEFDTYIPVNPGDVVER